MWDERYEIGEGIGHPSTSSGQVGQREIQLAEEKGQRTEVRGLGEEGRLVY